MVLAVQGTWLGHILLSLWIRMYDAYISVDWSKIKTVSRSFEIVANFELPQVEEAPYQNMEKVCAGP